MEIENSANRPIVTLHTFAFAAIAATLDPALLVNPTAPELQHLCHYQAIATADQFHWVNALKIYLRHPAARDYSLLRLAKSLSLTIVEVLAISLSIAVEQDPIAGRILAYLQAPLDGSRPTLGLLSLAFSPLPHSVSVIDRLMIGNAIASGLLQLLNASAPLPEQSIKVPLHLGLALRGHVIAAAWTGEGVGLDALAQPLTDAIPDNALVMTPALRDELQMLFLRCRHRDRLVTGLGLSATVRYHPGVRSLFVGASGTGKTLAAGWLATKLGMPLYRVDLASITSKYIGETEKNLSQLLSRAEQAEVVLLFDEADSLFGKRTEVQQANDRFANAQTNYLLQRIESFDGITLLTSNSRSRFDSAFSRRLDMIIEFPLPQAEERRSLWQSHLGDRHHLTQPQLNQLAASVDLSGGNIRNAVLAAAVIAQSQVRPITFADVVQGVASEYRKLGRQLSAELIGDRVSIL